MTTIYLRNLRSASEIEVGYMDLYGTTGKRYRNRAMNIPGYGWIPCSRRLQCDFTTDPTKLVVVISDPSDRNCCVTSNIWVTRSNVVRTLGYAR